MSRDPSQTNLDSPEGSERLLARPQGDDISFHQQADRQVDQLVVSVGPVKGPWRGRGCVQVRVERWRPAGVTHTPRQVVCSRRRRGMVRPSSSSHDWCTSLSVMNSLIFVFISFKYNEWYSGVCYLCPVFNAEHFLQLKLGLGDYGQK